MTRINRRALGSAAAIAWALASAPAAYAQATYNFNLPAQSLDRSLRSVGRQAGANIVFEPAAVRGREAPALVGSYSAEQAIERLLTGSGLTASRTAGGSWVISSGETEAGSAAADNGSADPDIVVVGTNIRGIYPSSSPVETYTARDIERTGATTTEQFVSRLPQNMGTRTQFATAAVSNSAESENRTGITGVDLRGLGVGTTLVLLNGRRLAPGDRGQAVDVSMIPAGALERVEVLTDGASAIYGSDAIGGVVNFVLRRDFDGAETRLSYGGASGLRQGDFTQMFGRSWGSGHALVSYNFYSATGLDVTDRDYSAAAERGLLTPVQQRQSFLASFSQNITERLEVVGDIAYSIRDTTTAYSNNTSTNRLNHLVATQRSSTDQLFANLSLDYHITDSLTATVAATYSNVDTSGRFTQLLYNEVPPRISGDRLGVQQSSLWDVTALLNGSLFRLPAGRVRFSLGAGIETEEYAGETTTIVSTTGRLGRRTTYAFGELFIPLASPELHIPLINRLEVSLAARYTDYSDESDPALPRDFGDGIDPKVGVLWSPFNGLNLRATYGTSFRAPSLLQLDQTAATNAISNTLRIPFPTGPLASRLDIFGYAVPDLGPELAETYTIGFDFRPDFLRGFRLSATYYNISYTDRIGPPIGGAAPLMNPELFPDVVYRPPSIAFVEEIFRTTNNSGLNLLNLNLADPLAAATVFFNSPNAWIRDSRIRNLALSEQDGFDISASYDRATRFGSVRFGAALTHISSYVQQITPTSPVVSVINIVGRPVDLRGRAFAGFSIGGLDADVTVNYVDDYANPFAIIGAQRVDSWTTVDLHLAYAFGDRAGLLRGAQVTLSAQNLFNQDPPFVSRAAANGVGLPIGFDPSNANPLGRFVILGLSKRW